MLFLSIFGAILFFVTNGSQIVVIGLSEEYVKHSNELCSDEEKHYITINKSHCFATDNQTNMQGYLEHTNELCLADCSNAYFVYCIKYGKRLCRTSTLPIYVVVPDYINENLPESYTRSSSENRICNFAHKHIFHVECYFNFNFGEQYDVNNSSTKEFNTTEPSSAKSTRDSYLYLYVGIGITVVVLVVIIQTTCVILYRKKVASTRQTLDIVLSSRDETRNNKNVRYSKAPALKEKGPVAIVGNDENIYASLESNLGTIAGDGMKNNNPDETRPKLPELPAQITQTLDFNNGSNTMSTRPKLPLPHEIRDPHWEVKTLPHNKIPASGAAERLPQLPLNNLSRPRPHVPLKKPGPNLLLNKPNNLISNSTTPRQALNPTPPTTSTTKVSFTSLTRPPAISRMNIYGDSSDEEWTYEKLPPAEAYLH